MSSSPRSPRSFTRVCPADVLQFTKPSKDFLCALSANKYQIEFLEFTISDYVTKNIIFMVGRDYPPPIDLDLDLGSLDENAYRLIKYEFSEDVLRLPSIQTSLVFSVGEQEVPNFRMVERHYFRDQLVKSYDFGFGFCIPSSTNTWDAVYQVPPLDEDLIEEMIANPFETKSDSFYFVDDELIMHNKASYKYVPEDTAQAKKSYEDRYAGAKGTKKQASKYDSDEEEGGCSGDGSEEGGDQNHNNNGGEQKAGGKYDEEDGDGGVRGSRHRRGSVESGGLGDDRGGEDDDPWSKETDYY
ncbi:unnamed protein product [Ectocarpus sp. 12 AP-2014]